MDITQSVLLACSVVGLILALFTRYIKTGSLLALLALFGYFYKLGMDSWLPLLLFIVGLFMIVLELFIPDFGILAIAGLASFITGLYLATQNWMVVIQDISIALVVAIIVMTILIRHTKLNHRYERFVLTRVSSQEKTSNTHTTHPELKVGQIGTTLTPLRPIGFARFELNDQRTVEVDVSSEIEAIEKNQSIRIEHITGNKIIVRSV